MLRGWILRLTLYILTDLTLGLRCYQLIFMIWYAYLSFTIDNILFYTNKTFILFYPSSSWPCCVFILLLECTFVSNINTNTFQFSKTFDFVKSSQNWRANGQYIIFRYKWNDTINWKWINCLQLDILFVMCTNILCCRWLVDFDSFDISVCFRK